MKIGLVFDDSLDKTDGVAQYVLITGQWLTAQGHDVYYLVGQTTRTDIPNLYSLSRNVKVRFNQNRMSMPLPAPKKAIRELLRREQFDVLHIQMPYSPAMAGRILSAVDDTTAVVGTFHVAPHSPLVHAGNWLLGHMVARQLKRFDAIMSVSAVARDFAKQTFRIPSTVVPLGLPLDAFYTAKPFDEYKNVRTILFMGRLVERKGCQYLLDAVARLKDARMLPDNVRVVICGAGPLQAQLQKFVRTHNLEDIVIFEGFISEADKPRYLASGDIVVYPSTGGESFGIVLLEAMAAARGAVLAGNNPGYAGVMGSHTSSLFDPLQPAPLAEKLHHLLVEPAARKEARKWQRDYVRAFDIETVGPQIFEVYTQALHKRRA